MASTYVHHAEQYSDPSTGRPLVGVELRFYAAGSNVPKAVYYDEELTQPITKLVSDSNGWFSQYFMGYGKYRIDLVRPDEVNGDFVYWSHDNIEPAAGLGDDAYKFKINSADGTPDFAWWKIRDSETIKWHTFSATSASLAMSAEFIDSYKTMVAASGDVPGYLDEKFKDTDYVSWVYSAVKVEPVLDIDKINTYKVKNYSGDTPGYHDDKHSDDIDVQFTPNSATGKLDTIVYQLTGLGAALSPVKTSFEYEILGPFADPTYAGGRGIAAGKIYVGGEHIDAWIAQSNSGHLYKTTNLWQSTILSGGTPVEYNGRTVISGGQPDASFYDKYGFPNSYGVGNISYLYMPNVGENCWVVGAGNMRRFYYIPDVPSAYESNGWFKKDSWAYIDYSGAASSPIDVISDNITHDTCFLGDDVVIGYTNDMVTFYAAYTHTGIVAGIADDGYGNCIAVGKFDGKVFKSSDHGKPGTWAPMAGFYLDGVWVDHLPNQIEASTQWGNICGAYGQWAIFNYYILPGKPAYVWSDDGINWFTYVSPDNSVASFYSVGFDGVRFYGTNAVFHQDPPVYQVLISSIPSHRKFVAEKGLAVAGETFLYNIPDAQALGTDIHGRIIATSASSVPSGVIHIATDANIPLSAGVATSIYHSIESGHAWSTVNDTYDYHVADATYTNSICVGPNSDLYMTCYNGFVYRGVINGEDSVTLTSTSSPAYSWRSITTGPDGNLYGITPDTGIIHKGVVVSGAEVTYSFIYVTPSDISWNSICTHKDNMYVVGVGTGALVYKVTIDGASLTLENTGIAVDNAYQMGTGPDGLLYVTQYGGKMIRINTDTMESAEVGPIDDHVGVTAGADGFLYINTTDGLKRYSVTNSDIVYAGTVAASVNGQYVVNGPDNRLYYLKYSSGMYQYKSPWIPVAAVGGSVGGAVGGGGGSSYTLPEATGSTLGGVKVGTGIAVSAGVISIGEYIPAAMYGAPSGVAPLDGTSKVPSAYLPSYVSDIITVDTYGDLPPTGEIDKIYITEDTNITYRWSGSAYVEISASLALGETSSTAYRGDRGASAYNHSNITSGNPHHVQMGDLATIVAPSNGQYMGYSAGNWQNLNIPANSYTTFASLTDVDMTGLGNGQIAMYSAGPNKWIPYTPASYSLPVATPSTLGGIKIGDGLIATSAGNMSVSAANNRGIGVNSEGLSLYLTPHGASMITTYNIGPQTFLHFSYDTNTFSAITGVTGILAAKLALKGGTSATIGGARPMSTSGIGYNSNGSIWIKYGSGLSMSGDGSLICTASSYTLPTATSATLGGIKVGDGLGISGSGVLYNSIGAYTLPTATSATLGGVKVGDGLGISGDGVLYGTVQPYTLPNATSGTTGGIRLGSGVAVSGSNNLYIPIATSASPGIAKIGTGLAMSGDTVYNTVSSYTLPIATSGTLGGVKISNRFDVDYLDTLYPREGIFSYLFYQKPSQGTFAKGPFSAGEVYLLPYDLYDGVQYVNCSIGDGEYSAYPIKVPDSGVYEILFEYYLNLSQNPDVAAKTLQYGIIKNGVILDEPYKKSIIQGPFSGTGSTINMSNSIMLDANDCITFYIKSIEGNTWYTGSIPTLKVIRTCGLPAATSTTLGAVKVGSGLAMSGDTIYSTGGGGSSTVSYYYGERTSSIGVYYDTGWNAITYDKMATNTYSGCTYGSGSYANYMVKAPVDGSYKIHAVISLQNIAGNGLTTTVGIMKNGTVLSYPLQYSSTQSLYNINTFTLLGCILLNKDDCISVAVSPSFGADYNITAAYISMAI